MLQELSQVIFQVLGPIALMASAGYLLRRQLVVDVRSISRIVFYILAPCLIYTSVVKMEFDPATTWRSLLFAAINMVVMLTLATLLARRWKYNGNLGNAFIFTAILLNNGNYGLPLNLFAFGPAGFGYALVLFMFNSLVGSVIGVYLLARGQNGGRTALRRTLATPIVWAMILAFISRAVGWSPSGSLMDMMNLAGQAAIPVFLIVLGMSLTGMRARLGHNPVTRLTLLKMLGGPAIAVVLGRLVGLSGIPYAVAVMQGSMPTAVNAIVISNEFEAAPDFVAGAVLFTTLASIVTLPALLLLLM